jgi:hypothetical protein
MANEKTSKNLHVRPGSLFEKPAVYMFELRAAKGRHRSSHRAKPLQSEQRPLER